MKTRFASPDRSAQDEIMRAKDKILEEKAFVEGVNSFHEIVMFLNRNRHNVFHNKMLLRTVEVTESEDLLGKRPGEIFNCVNASKEESGCGTSLFCKECGAVKAILKAQAGEPNYEECRMIISTDKGEDALDLRVWAVPFSALGETLTIFTIKDIGDEKRRQLLERAFFHDLLNEATIIKAYSENVRDGMIEEGEDSIENIHGFTERMI